MTIKTIAQTSKLALALVFGLSSFGAITNMAMAAEAIAAADSQASGVLYRQLDVNGVKIAYREAGDTSQPTILLLHGFPTSSQMFRNLIPALAAR